jgi:voltage-gated potassium channel
MAIDTPERGRRARADALARRAEYRFGFLLLLLLATFMVLALGTAGPWALFTVGLQALTLVVALAAAGVPKPVRRGAVVLIVVTFAVSIFIVPGNGRDAASGAGFINVALVAGAPIAIVWSVFRRRVIDVQTMLAALCVYVLIGMFFAFLYIGIGDAGAHPFFAQVSRPSTADYQYFSFVTLTTTGFGDLTAASNLGRSIAVLEALFGQIYLVTIVAVIVANLGGKRRADRVGE